MNISKILVVVDPKKKNDTLISRIKRLAVNYGASVELYIPSYNAAIANSHWLYQEGMEQARKLYIEKKQQWLNSLVNDLNAGGIDAGGCVEWVKPKHRGVLDRVDKVGADLIVMRAEQHSVMVRAIFSNTKEMLTFFSEKLGMDYPWDKYAQIVVRDYVSGAMENTTGVIFGKFVQKTERELIDNHNENIIAHELIHHWFGDLVTCESWANLALNESFANYGEYLWLEYKYGKDEADHHMHRELGGYLYTSDRNMHDLVNFNYHDREDMFDAHSYNKGGCILHSLRNYIGDEAFFAGLNMYLKTLQILSRLRKSNM